MIIIKIIFIYFIEIAHPDDFPSTGTRIVGIIPKQFRMYKSAIRVQLAQQILTTRRRLSFISQYIEPASGVGVCCMRIQISNSSYQISCILSPHRMSHC